MAVQVVSLLGLSPCILGQANCKRPARIQFKLLSPKQTRYSYTLREVFFETVYYKLQKHHLLTKKYYGLYESSNCIIEFRVKKLSKIQ
jgi:hypothetical protein